MMVWDPRMLWNEVKIRKGKNPTDYGEIWKARQGSNYVLTNGCICWWKRKLVFDFLSTYDMGYFDCTAILMNFQVWARVEAPRFTINVHHCVVVVGQVAEAVKPPKSYLSWLREQREELLDNLPEDRKFKGRVLTRFLLHEADEVLMDGLLDVSKTLTKITATRQEMKSVTKKQALTQAIVSVTEYLFHSFPFQMCTWFLRNPLLV